MTNNRIAVLVAIEGADEGLKRALNSALRRRINQMAWASAALRSQ